MPSDPRADKAPSDGSVRGESAGRGGAVGGERIGQIVQCDWDWDHSPHSQQIGSTVYACPGRGFTAARPIVRRDPSASSGEPPQAPPKYCPWCGSQVAKWGHDTSCRRPANASLHVIPPSPTDCWCRGCQYDGPCVTGSKPWPTSERQHRRDSDRAYRVESRSKLRRGSWHRWLGDQGSRLFGRSGSVQRQLGTLFRWPRVPR